MTEAALQEFIKREFPAEMSVTEVADKLDTMQAHPDIEQIRTCFNNVLLDAIRWIIWNIRKTEGIF